MNLHYIDSYILQTNLSIKIRNITSGKMIMLFSTHSNQHVQILGELLLSTPVGFHERQRDFFSMIYFKNTQMSLISQQNYVFFYCESLL